MLLLYYCLISSLLIGGWHLYNVYQSDKDEKNWIISPSGKNVKILSSDSPILVKLLLVTTFIPFINIFWLIILIFEYITERK